MSYSCFMGEQHFVERRYNVLYVLCSDYTKVSPNTTSWHCAAPCYYNSNCHVLNMNE